MTPERKEKEWRNLLSFASAFSFPSLITTALAGLDKYLQPVEKILLGDQLGIPELNHQGVRALCTRKAFLSPDEGRALGLENVMCVARLREGTMCYQPDRAGRLAEKFIGEALAQRLIEPPAATAAPNGAGAASNPPAAGAASSTAAAGSSSPSASSKQNNVNLAQTETGTGAKSKGKDGNNKVGNGNSTSTQ